MRKLFVLLLIVGLSSSLGASNKVSATVTIDNTSGGVALPASLINPTGGGQQKYCTGRLETANIRYWSSGSTPTTTVGILVQPLEILSITGYESMVLFRAIRTTGTSGSLSLECWR